MTVNEKIPIWLDCDPGNDDAFAILLAKFHSAFKLLGISTVHGNVQLKLTTHNALGLLDLLKIPHDDLKVYSGSETPLVKPGKTATHVHGKSGIGGIELPENPEHQVSRDIGYLDAIRNAILAHRKKICLVCTGPLTNIAKLFSTYPELKNEVRYISIMGGGFDIGNITPYSEFNFNCDPHAAFNVVTDPILAEKIILAPLNITHKAVANQKIRNELYNATTKRSQLRIQFHDILMFFAQAYAKSQAFIEGPPVHDPLAVFLLLPFTQNSIDFKFKYEKKQITVITEGDHEGETRIVENESHLDSTGVHIGCDIDMELFWSYLLEALENADKHVSSEIN